MITSEQVYDLRGDYDDDSVSDQDSDDSSIVSWESRVTQLCRESLWLSVNLPRSYSYAMSHDYLKDEVLEALRLVSGAREALTNGEDSLRKSIIIAKRDEISALTDHAAQCYSWAEHIVGEMREFEKAWYTTRSTKYLRGIGYDKNDLGNLSTELNEYFDQRDLHGLSKRRDLKYHLAAIESDVCEKRAERIQKECRKALVDVHNRHKASRPASEWKYFPHHSLLVFQIQPSQTKSRPQCRRGASDFDKIS
ncbi:hypothetical protein EST38_g5306 [Candolleomyces aberdarensis]|uniref:Uncharacterized protein n=1 Tax=Candolleomyces aberdarensis TaxID=2316362 RepID=A0A4Q2DMU5_9AGAR|nr:hypothetical protein EST38_g5306 [Candolleomyces aberdarensis]